MPTAVNGACDQRFVAVRDAFTATFAAGRELGAALAVVADGHLVVDLWAGTADHRTGRRWERTTPCLAFSCVKAVTATCALRLVDRGELDLDAPVAAYWPEFGTGGKEKVTTRQLLAHQAGLPALAAPATLDEGNDAVAMAARLASQEPLWTPGEAHGYHALTFGWLVSEVVRRISGRSVGAFLRTEMAGPLGLDLWIGAPPEVADRAARLVSRLPSDRAGTPLGSPRTPIAPLVTALADPGSLTHTALLNPPLLGSPANANRRDVLCSEWPATGGVTTAVALARWYSALLGGKLLSLALLAEATSLHSSGEDRVLLMDTAFGLGFMLPSTVLPVPAAGGAAFGHTGAGGSLGMADLRHGVSLAYVTNRLGSGVSADRRSTDLLAALYSCLP
jgi:CubicO group peptidase (beta-lactamase class C family)